MSETTSTFELVDPNTVLLDVNVRAAAPLDKAFVRSIRDLGVLIPTVGFRDDESGQLIIRMGQCRTLAAIETGQQLPVVVTSRDKTDDVGRIIEQMHENGHRFALSTQDKIAAAEQLSLYGLSAAQIAKRTPLARPEVDAALTVAQSALAKGAAERYDFLTLDAASAVAEFEDSAEVVKALVAAAKKSDGDLQHVLQRARDEREQAAELAALVDQLTKEGVRIIERPDHSDKSIRRVGALVGSDDKRLSATTHAACPGHAVYITQTWQGVEAVPVCTDWRAQGHRDPVGASARPAGPMSEQQKAERRTVVANNQEWRSAEKVRRAWLTSFLARKSPPKGAAVYVASELGHGPRALSDALDKANGLAASLLGIDDRHSRQSVAALAAQASDPRAQVIALGVVLAAIERSTGVHSWRNPGEATRRYFAFLAAQGYVLSTVEQLAAAPERKPSRRTRRTAPPVSDTPTSAATTTPDGTTSESDPTEIASAA